VCQLPADLHPELAHDAIPGCPIFIPFSTPPSQHLTNISPSHPFLFLLLLLSVKMFQLMFDLGEYATTYRATRDAYLKAANELKLATGPYKAARDAYVRAPPSAQKTYCTWICMPFLLASSMHFPHVTDGQPTRHAGRWHRHLHQVPLRVNRTLGTRVTKDITQKSKKNNA
jgi:hypothetical protein